MNKHFEDATYYLKRAGEHAKQGFAEELEPIEARFRELTGGEDEPEPSRLEQIQQDLQELEEKAEGTARENIRDAREKISEYRAGN